MESTKNSLESVLKNRTVIPSWKSPQHIVETTSSNPARLLYRATLGDSWIKHQTATFEQFPSPNTANELYETAKLYGRERDLSSTVKELSGQLQDAIVPQDSKLLQHNNIGSEQIPISHDTSANIFESKARLKIHQLRRLLATDPNRPFCWSELSRYFLVVAEKKKAIRCMQAALKLAQHNRYLCRAATRLFVHFGKHERALALLRSEPTFKSDPWLLAAEIATSSSFNKQSHHINLAKQLVKSNHLATNQISELAAAVGTVELFNGATKQAKIFFNKSLVTPTGNSLAQAQWAIEQDTKIIIPQDAWQILAAHEAVTFASRKAHNWDRAFQACAMWLTEEPFSIRPTVLGSYLSFRPEHLKMVEQFASVGLKCYPENIALLNNRAVAKAYQGRVKEAFADVQVAFKYNKDAKENAYLLATLGLIAFRSGKPELGLDYYELSIGWFLELKDKISVASALLHLSLEQMRIDRSAISNSIDLAQLIVKLPITKQRPELFGMAELVLDEAHLATNADLTSNNRDFTSNGRNEVEPVSIDELTYQATLFDVPKNCKQTLSRIGYYSSIV